jgi:hypothetical protein
VISLDLRRFIPGWAGVLIALSTALAVAPCGAEPDVTIAIDCPSLDGEARAALETRAKAELLVRDASGTFVVVCRDGSAALTWHPLSGVPASSTSTMNTDSRTSIDGVLDALDDLLAGPAASVAAALAPVTTSPVAPPPTPVVPVVKAPPLSPPGTVAIPQASTRRPGWPGLLLGAGVATELWSQTATLGPRARIAVPLPSRFEVGAAGTLLFALRAPDGVSGRLIRVAVGGDYGIDDGDRFRIGADVFVELLHADAGVAGSADKVEFGGLLRASAAILTKPIRIAIGPTLAARPDTLRAQLGPNRDGSGGVTAFELHLFTVGIALDVTTGPVR